MLARDHALFQFKKKGMSNGPIHLVLYIGQPTNPFFFASGRHMWKQARNLRRFLYGNIYE